MSVADLNTYVELLFKFFKLARGSLCGATEQLPMLRTLPCQHIKWRFNVKIIYADFHSNVAVFVHPRLNHTLGQPGDGKGFSFSVAFWAQVVSDKNADCVPLKGQAHEE